MTAIKSNIKDSSLFRKIYIIDLLFCYISFLQIPAYVLLVAMFIWGVYLVIYNQRTNNTFFKLRFGLWVGAFLIASLIALMLNFSVTILYSFVMFLHILICFFIFYGMHTEPDFDFRNELYSIARIVVYVVTVANIIGIVCLMCGFRFEWQWVKFTIYENRFTGVYINPNYLGFVSVVAVMCCHMLYKPDFMKKVNQPRVSKIWIIGCVATSVFSLMLCDSNASIVLGLGYAIIYVIYIFFADKTGIAKPDKPVSKSKIFVKIVSLLLVGTLIIGSVLMFREICKAGFSVIVNKTSSFISLIVNGDDELYSDITGVPIINEKNEITFNHENKNVDSGRFKLWKESVNLFKLSPIIGISNGNIIFYSEEYADGVLSYSYHNNDLHNGFLTLLVSTGVIGFLLFGIFGFRFAKHAAQHLFLQKHTFRNDIYPCMFAFLSAYLLYALFEKALLYDISFMVMWFWLIMGYTSCYIAKFEPMLETQYLFHKKRLTRTLL